MTDRRHLDYFESCLRAIRENVPEDRTIYKIEMGVPRFGRQTFLAFRISTGALSMSGDGIDDVTDQFLGVNVDPPHAIMPLRPSEFISYDDPRRLETP
ncbi:MAG: hypothetical protein ABW184_06345 [Sphingobium sp.]